MSRGLKSVIVTAGVLAGGGVLWAASTDSPSGLSSSAPVAGERALSAARADSSTLVWRPDDVAEGTIFEIGVQVVTGDVQEIRGSFAGEDLHFWLADAGTWVSLAASPVDVRGAAPVEIDVVYASGATQRIESTLPVVEGDYRMERLTVAPEFGAPLSPELEARTEEEYARAMAVSRASHGTTRMWEIPFVPPRNSRITSGFGHGRVFNDQVTSRHMGTDFAGAVGEPVRAPARGRVVLVDSFYYGGNVIYVDHGAGLVTAYLHLSEQDVEEGDLVEPGQIIGQVGATGRVTGPHLHWIVRYGEITVDGMSLLALE